MKKGNLEKWNDIQSCKNLLFFSQLVNELLFDYSIPSNRVSTLNSHFLCLDALNAIIGIEENGIPEGNLKPIVEELHSALLVDPIFKTSANSPLYYFMKYENNKYRISNKVSELNYDDMKKAVHSIYTLFFQDEKYYNSIKERIIEIIMNNDASLQMDLFRLVKSLLTELINLGYTPQYIYYVMDINYWNSKVNIETPERIDLFFDAFDLIKKKYKVAFIVDNNKFDKFAKFIDDIEVTSELERITNSHNESQFLRIKRNQSFIIIEKSALDFYGAAIQARNMLSFNISIFRLNNHEYRYNINTLKCGVYDENEFYRIPSPKSATSHKKMPSDKQIKDNMNNIYEALRVAIEKKNYDIPDRIIKAIEFHSHSLDSISKENQLLDFWAIFESVLNISNKHISDRINQVCSYLVPVLKCKYIYSLFEQLSSDIKTYSEDEYNLIVGNETENKKIIQKVFEFAVLEEKKSDREKFIRKCDDFPLLQERISYYSNTLYNPKAVNSFLEKHAIRVKWQIMRIYRNRNLIIHNGDSMPYLNLLIENLHSYVDEFIEYVIHSVKNGHTIESMCHELYIKECNWNTQFAQNKSKNLDSELIENILSY